MIPSSHKEIAEDSFNEKGSCGFRFGNGCSEAETQSLFGGNKTPKIFKPEEVA